MQHQEEDNAPIEQLWKISKDYKKEYQPNVAVGLSKLKAKIAQEESVSVPTKIISINRRLWLGRIAAAVALLVTCNFLFLLFVNNTPEIQQLTTTDTLIEKVLPDGSTVWLNKQSQLSFPTTFSTKERVVQLNGEAFFKVTKHPNQPFIVQLPNSEIKVLGTAFNVRAYPEETTTVVEVAEGKVAFKAVGTQAPTILEANDKVMLNNVDATLSDIQALDWTTTAWKAKQLNFADRPIREISNYLMTNFGIELDFDAEKLGDCPFNATLVKNTPTAILKKVDLAFPSIQLKEVHSKYYQLRGTCN